MVAIDVRALAGAARQRLEEALRPPRRLRADDYRQIEAEIHEAAKLTTPYGFMLFSACGIAALGLLQSSVAVVIGAMLISPLMGPILSMGMALARVEPRAFKSAAITLGVGCLVSILASTLIVWASPLKDVTPEILARTRPTLLDLIVALLSGFVGAYLTINRKAGAIAGVAIATALMPPLAVVGYGLATRTWAVAGGASLLFLTNVVAILGAVFGVARRYGFTPAARAGGAWEAPALFVVTALLCVPLALSLRSIVVEARETVRVRSAIESAFAGASPHITDLAVETRNGGATGVKCVVVTRRYIPDAPVRIAAKLNPGAVISVEQVVTAQGAPAPTTAQGSLGRRPEADLLTLATRPDQRLRLMLGAAGQVLSVSTGGGGALTVNLVLPPAATLADYRAAERAAQRFTPEARVEVLPPLGPLPEVRFARGSSRLDAAGEAQVDDVAWALTRWASGGVVVEGSASPGRPGRRAADVRMAERRARAVAERLTAAGVKVAVIETRVPERLDGDEAPYLVARVRPAAGQPTLATAPGVAAAKAPVGESSL